MMELTIKMSLTREHSSLTSHTPNEETGGLVNSPRAPGTCAPIRSLCSKDLHARMGVALNSMDPACGLCLRAHDL